MQRPGFVTVIGVLCLLSGCGSLEGGGGAATTACTLQTGGQRQCVETSTNAAATGGLAAAQSDCVKEGVVASDVCSHSGADGGCKTVIASGLITVSTTLWTYTGVAGTASAEMSGCIATGTPGSLRSRQMARDERANISRARCLGSRAAWHKTASSGRGIAFEKDAEPRALVTILATQFARSSNEVRLALSPGPPGASLARPPPSPAGVVARM